MSLLFNSLIGLAPLLILAGIIAVMIGATKRDRSADPGIGTVRRLLGYGASLAGLGLLTAGSTLLLRIVLEATTGEGAEETLLALGLALAIVGTPVWIGSWLIMERVVRSRPGEARSLGRKAYLHIVLGGSALAVIFGSISFFSTIGRAGAIDETTLAIVLLTLAVWAFHWRTHEREGQLDEVTMTVRRVYVYGISLVSVVIAAIGVGSLLTIVMSAAYRVLFDSPEIIAGSSRVWNEGAQVAAAQVGVGAAAAWWHWIRSAKNDAGSLLRSIYLYPVAILGGAVAVVVASSVGLYHVMQWWFGDPDTSSTVAHFDLFPGLIATGIVGAAVWIYHWDVARREASADEAAAASANRIYHYLVSALGLGTLAVGMVMLFELFLGLVSPSSQPNLRGDLWRNPLALTVTLLAVGAPAWLIYWRRVQLAADRLGAVERDSLSRRLFIYGTFGVALIASLVTLSIVLFFAFEAILGDRAGGRLLWDSRWGIAILLTAGASTAYFWQVLREDRAVIGEADLPREAKARELRVTVIVPAGSGEFLAHLEAALGYRVTVWRAGSGLEAMDGIDPSEFDRIVAELRDLASESALLIAEGGRLRVLPYEAQSN